MLLHHVTITQSCIVHLNRIITDFPARTVVLFGPRILLRALVYLFKVVVNFSTSSFVFRPDFEVWILGRNARV
jgi:hypothetical protein